MFDPWVEKIPWKRKWQPIQEFLPGEYCGQRNMAGYSPWGRKSVENPLVTDNNKNNECSILVLQPGIKSSSLALEGRFLTTGPQGKSELNSLELMVLVLIDWSVALIWNGPVFISKVSLGDYSERSSYKWAEMKEM